MEEGTNWARPLGLAAIGFSVLYFLTDVVEAAQDGFSDWQLWLTLIAELAIPAIVVGLYLVQRPQIGRLGAWGAGLYAYVYVFFSFTVVYAIVDGTPDFSALSDDLDPWMLIHGALMVIAGLAFAIGTLRAAVLPRWTAWMLIAGVILVAATDGAGPALELPAVAIRDAAFAGMGLALLKGSPPARR